MKYYHQADSWNNQQNKQLSKGNFFSHPKNLIHRMNNVQAEMNIDHFSYTKIS